jgi:glutamate-1-semialdehyde 2,1-aminomutase
LELTLSIAQSKKLAERAGVLAGGTSSDARAILVHGGYEGFPIQMPSYFDRAIGSHIIDVDGNDFVDFNLGFGPALLGHAHPDVNRAVAETINRGVFFGANTENEIKVAEKIAKHVPCAEQVRLSNTGSDATSIATRAARAYNGRQKILKFEGHYHGWHDWCCVWTSGTNVAGGGVHNDPRPSHTVLAADGVPENTVDNVIVIPWNNPELLERTIRKEANDLAAVITEPYQSNGGIIAPEEGYLELMRKLTRDNDIVLIFDEVVTGFRLGLGGAQEYLSVTPDMATFSKALGNGFPISAVAGQRKFMTPFQEERIWARGTFTGNLASTAACLATLTQLESKDYSQLYKMGDRIMKAIRDAMADHHVPGVVQGPGSMWGVYFTPFERVTSSRDLFLTPAYPDIRRSQVFYREVIGRNMWCHPSRYNRMLVSFAHTEEDVDRMIEACQYGVKAAKKIEG